MIYEDYSEALEEIDESKGEELVQAFLNRRCNVLASGLSDITLAQDLVGNDANFDTLSPFSKDVVDPLALVTRHDDRQWSDFVYLVVTAIFYAEENGISVANANSMPEVTLFGTQYTQMLRQAITAVGSYGDIYQRNFKVRFPRSGLNHLYSKNFSTPLLYALHNLKNIQ